MHDVWGFFFYTLPKMSFSGRRTVHVVCFVSVFTELIDILRCKFGIGMNAICLKVLISALYLVCTSFKYM
jgi:hypothetical protein